MYFKKLQTTIFKLLYQTPHIVFLFLFFGPLIKKEKRKKEKKEKKWCGIGPVRFKMWSGKDDNRESNITNCLVLFCCVNPFSLSR